MFQAAEMANADITSETHTKWFGLPERNLDS